LSLVLESLKMPRIEHGRKGEYLECDTAVQRNLIRLINDTHAAAANLADNAIFAEHAECGSRRTGRLCRNRRIVRKR
jgi:hypothetical protein